VVGFTDNLKKSVTKAALRIAGDALRKMPTFIRDTIQRPTNANEPFWLRSKIAIFGTSSR
jgi:hypothetical protein